MFSLHVPSVMLNLAKPEEERHLWLSSRSFSLTSLCSLTHDSCVISPREYRTAALNQPFVSLDTLFIIFPGRGDSEHQFKASSGPAAS